jgi:hypothetical protein
MDTDIDFLIVILYSRSVLQKDNIRKINLESFA